MSPALRTTAALLLLGLSACGDRGSHKDLEARVAELEDENDLLKQQLADARLQAEEAMIAAERAKDNVHAFAPPIIPDIPQDPLVDGREDSTDDSDPAPRRAGSSASSAAAAAAEAAETARQALEH